MLSTTAFPLFRKGGPPKKKSAEDLNKHARKRAAERFDIVLSKELRRELVAAIRNGKAKFVERQSLSRTKWLVMLGDKPAVAVYDSLRHTIATVLPPEWVPQSEQPGPDAR